MTAEKACRALGILQDQLLGIRKVPNVALETRDQGKASRGGRTSKGRTRPRSVGEEVISMMAVEFDDAGHSRWIRGTTASCRARSCRRAGRKSEVGVRCSREREHTHLTCVGYASSEMRQGAAFAANPRPNPMIVRAPMNTPIVFEAVCIAIPASMRTQPKAMARLRPKWSVTLRASQDLADGLRYAKEAH